MPTNSVWPIADSEGLARAFEEAAGTLETVDGEIAFDLSAVRRIDAAAIGALQLLSDKAMARGVKVSLRGANVDIYKALKLVHLESVISSGR